MGTHELVPVSNIQAGELETIQRTAKLLAVSSYFDAKGDTPIAIAQVATKILAGRELGFGPFAAVNGIYIIKGRPSVGANLMASAVKGSGRYDYRVRKMGDDEVSIEFFEIVGGKHESIGISTFTANDARKAGTQNMDKFPRNMLFARAMSNGVRFYCPDVFSGNAVYVPEELGATTDADGNVIEGDFRPVQSTAQRPALQSQDEDFGMSGGEAPTETSWYAVARDNLVNGVRKLADAAAEDHQRGINERIDQKRYGWLAGLLDGIVKTATNADDGHKRVLAVLCQDNIGRDNRPAAVLANKLLDKLATHIVDGDGNKVESPLYDQRVVDACVTIWHSAQAVATPSLFDEPVAA